MEIPAPGGSPPIHKHSDYVKYCQSLIHAGHKTMNSLPNSFMGESSIVKASAVQVGGSTVLKSN